MARTKPGARMSRPYREPDSELRGELRSACKTSNIERVREMLDAGSVTAADATSCLDDAHANFSVVRMLLEHGAEPSGCARVCRLKESLDLVMLLVEFGYDISINGHCILQDYVDSRESIDWLLDHGVDITKTDHERTNDGTRPGQCHDFSLKILDKVSAAGDIEYFDYLVSHGADPYRSMALHCTTKCKDPQKMAAMAYHLLDFYHMNLEANNEDLRDFFHAAEDSGTPLNCAVYYHNLPAVQKLLDRGSNPKKAITQAIDHELTHPWLPAVAPLLDAGTDSIAAFETAVRYLNFEAAKICLEKGADPRQMLKVQEIKAAKRAAGTFDRYVDDEEPGFYSSEDDDERAVQTKEMRRLVRSAAEEFARSRTTD